MSNKILQHPMFRRAGDIIEICNPLKQLEISYFAHVFVDNKLNFSAVGNNPEFGEIYLLNKFYNADIHLAESNQFGRYVMWDALELGGKSREMHAIANRYGVKHTFTIIDKKTEGTHFYHFANSEESKNINQTYLSSLLLLEKFITHFNSEIQQSKELVDSYKMKFSIDAEAEGYMLQHNNKKSIEEQQTIFLNEINPSVIDSNTIIGKNTAKPVALAPQQMKCLQLLLVGNSAKQIAHDLDLSPRTVEHYLERIRKLLGCKSSKEMIAHYRTRSS